MMYNICVIHSIYAYSHTPPIIWPLPSREVVRTSREHVPQHLSTVVGAPPTVLVFPTFPSRMLWPLAGMMFLKAFVSSLPLTVLSISFLVYVVVFSHAFRNECLIYLFSFLLLYIFSILKYSDRCCSYSWILLSFHSHYPHQILQL